MKRSLLLGPVLLFTCAAELPPSVVLRYGFTPGQTLEYRTEYVQRLRLKNPRGQLGNLDLVTRYALDLDQKVVKAGPTYAILARPKNVKVELQGPMAASSEQIADMLRKVSFTLELDARGRVSGLAESASTPEAMKKLVTGLKSALGQMMPTFPEGPQRVGSSWRQSVPLPVELPTGDKLQAVLTVDYLLRGFASVGGRPCADVGMRLHVGIGGSMGQGGGRVDVAGQGTGQGFAYLDLSRGILVATGVALATSSKFKSAAVELDQASEVEMWMALR